MNLASMYLELLREAHAHAVSQGAVLTGGQALGLGGRIDDNAAYTVPTESQKVNAKANSYLADYGLTHADVVDLLVDDFGIRPSDLAYAWDIPTYPVMREGQLQPEGVPEFFGGNPLDPDRAYFGGEYRPNNLIFNRQGRDQSQSMTTQSAPMSGEGYNPNNPLKRFGQEKVRAYPAAQGPVYERIFDIVPNTPTEWAVELAAGALLGPTIGGRALKYLGKSLKGIPPALLARFRGVSRKSDDWVSPRPDKPFDYDADIENTIDQMLAGIDDEYAGLVRGDEDEVLQLRKAIEDAEAADPHTFEDLDMVWSEQDQAFVDKLIEWASDDLGVEGGIKQLEEWLATMTPEDLEWYRLFILKRRLGMGPDDAITPSAWDEMERMRAEPPEDFDPHRGYMEEGLESGAGGGPPDEPPHFGGLFGDDEGLSEFGDYPASWDHVLEPEDRAIRLEGHPDAAGIRERERLADAGLPFKPWRRHPDPSVYASITEYDIAVNEWAEEMWPGLSDFDLSDVHEAGGVDGLLQGGRADDYYKDIPLTERTSEQWTTPRRLAAWKMRQEGVTYREIGEQFGYSPERARKVVADAERDFAYRDEYLRALEDPRQNPRDVTDFYTGEGRNRVRRTEGPPGTPDWDQLTPEEAAGYRRRLERERGPDVWEDPALSGAEPAAPPGVEGPPGTEGERLRRMAEQLEADQARWEQMLQMPRTESVPPPGKSMEEAIRSLQGAAGVGMATAITAQSLFPEQVERVVSGLGRFNDGWWSWIKDFPEHLDWMVRATGATLDGMEAGSRSTGDPVLDSLNDGWRGQVGALAGQLGGGVMPLMGGTDASMLKGVGKDLSENGHNGNAILPNNIRREIENGDAMIVGYRTDADYERAVAQAGRYGVEIDRHFWRRPTTKNIGPVQGEPWTPEHLKKLATTHHFYPDAGLRRGPR